MNEIEKQLSSYEFFKNKNFEIYSIQDYGRKSKFKMEMANNYYTVILEEQRIKPYVSKIKILGENFKKMIGLQYVSEDNKVLVLEYYGNNQGMDLIKLEHSNYDLLDEDYALQLKQIIDSIHSNKQKYVDFSDNNFSSWQDYYLFEISEKINSIYNQNLIDDKTKEVLLQKLEYSSKIYANFQTTFIHADITPLNVCIDIENKNLYLIDYDDFKIGDPLMDISRIINCKNMSKIFAALVDKYYHVYENNMNHLFYTLRVNINWYNHIIEKKQEDMYDLEKAKQDVFTIIEKIVNY